MFCFCNSYLEVRTGNDTRTTEKFWAKNDPKEKHSNLKKTIMSVDVVQVRDSIIFLSSPNSAIKVFEFEKN